MKWIKLYLKERRKEALGAIVLFLIYAVVSWLAKIPFAVFSYVLELWLVFVLLFGVWDGYKYRQKYQLTEKNLEQKSLEILEFSETESPMEQLYLQIIEKQKIERRKIQEQQCQTMTQMRDYYATWAHQIKTPIAAMDLMLQAAMEEPEMINEKGLKSLKEELFKISFYTEAVMNYLRLEDTSSDYHFSEYSIKSIFYKTVKKFSSQFIYKKITLQVQCEEEKIYTDEKWFGFILEQLLSNALKYTKDGGRIRLYLEKSENNAETICVVEDNGIGIREEDLPRIMERGFTGYNGRMDKNSTGIGLYLCKKAADKLGAELRFDSGLEKGTKVKIFLQQKHTKHE